MSDEHHARPRLRTRRGLLATAMPAIAVLAAVGAALAFWHYRSVVDDRRAEVLALAEAAAIDAQRFVEDQFAVLAAAAGAPPVRRGHIPQIDRYLPLVASSGRFTSGVGYIDADLQAKAYSGGLPGGRPSSVRDRAYARAALGDGAPVLSDVIPGRFRGGAPILVFAQPVASGSGPPTGLLTGSIRLDQIQVAARLARVPDGYGLILDGEDHMIAGPEPIEDLEDPPAAYDVAAMRAQGRGVIPNLDAEDGRRLVGYTTVGELGWLVVVSRSYAEVIGPLDTALAAEILTLVLLAALGVVVMLNAARRLDRIDAEQAAALHEQRTIAVRLQESLLPELPAPEGVQVDARYAPAEGALSVGGDWFDVVELADGRLALSVGDVTGHGLPAAAAMGQLRSAVRMLALGRHEPADALGRLDDFVGALGGRPLATVVYAILDPGLARVRYACAGHPPPLLVRADGRAEFLDDGRSPLLGVPPSQPRAVGGASLRPGDTLVFYTDGLVERPGRSIDEGLADFAARAAAIGAGDTAALAEGLMGAVAEPRRDDAAVLCVRLVPDPDPDPGAAPSAPPQPSSVPS